MKKWHKLKKNTFLAYCVVVCGVIGVFFGAIPTLAVSNQTCTTTNGITTCTRSANASVTVSASCTLYGGASGTSTSDSSYSGSVNPGATTTINGSKLTTICNDPSGYALYAIGYSGDSYDTPTNTQMIGTNGNISTGTATSGSTSNWAMKVNPVSGSYPTINNSFNSFHVVPEDYTKIATYTSNTASSSSTGAAVQAAYQVYASSTQAAGAYTGKVKYTMVHPNTALAPEPIYDMQNLAADKCTTTPTTVVDSRDGEEYKIQRLADGKCWMLDNLRLGGSSTMSLTPADTNITSNFTLPASTTTGFDGISTSFTQPAMNADYKNTTTTSYGAGSGKIGNYYNYCAASGGTYCYAPDSGTDDAQYDICPAGWRMPTGGDYQGDGVGDGEYFALATALGLTFDEGEWELFGTTYQTALSTPLSGNFSDGSAHFQGTLGLFWSSTSSASNRGYGMYLLYASSVSVIPPNFDERHIGVSVRCVMKTPTM